MLEAQVSSGTSFIQEVRQLLTSDEPDGLYMFIHCLSSVDPKLWAGTSPEIPAVLEEWEVERVMSLLDSEDKLIRKQVSVNMSTGYNQAARTNASSVDLAYAVACRSDHCGILLCSSTPGTAVRRTAPPSSGDC